MPEKIKVDITYAAIFRVIAVILGLWFLYLVRDIVLLFFLTIIIVMTLAPVVNSWQKYLPRSLAVGLIFVMIVAAIGLILGVVIPPLTSQLTDLAVSLPEYAVLAQSKLQNYNLASLQSFELAQKAISSLSGQFSRLGSGVVSTTLGVFSGIFTAFTVLVLSAYLLFEEEGLRKFWFALLPIDRKEPTIKLFDKVGLRLGAWLRGQLLLMLTIGITGYFLALGLNLPYALALGLWTGLTEILPFVGPILGGVPIVLLALLDSPIKGLIALIALIIIQQLESNLIVPRVMQKAVGLSPVVVILALMIGGKLYGIIGTILAVPLAATLSVLVSEWPKWRQQRRLHS